MSISFFGMSLTDIFEVPQIQSLLLKFWYLGLTSENLVVEHEKQYFKMVKKNLNFANCFTFELPTQMYYSMLERIAVALQHLNCKKMLAAIINYLKVNKLGFIAFEIFGLHFLQFFGKILESLNEKIMTKIIRSVFINITETNKYGKVILKANEQEIQKIDTDQFFPPEIKNKIPVETEQKHPQKTLYESNRSERDRSVTTFPKLTTIQGRLDLKRFYVKSNRLDKSDGGSYPVGEKMRNKQKANLSAFMVGGFEIVDYSQSINHLHKKLLSKILLNK